MAGLEKVAGGCGITETFANEICEHLDNQDIHQPKLTPAEVLAIVGPHAEPATTAPIPDNRADTDLRVAEIGTSLEYARADHKHAVRRQTILPDPAISVAGGGGVLTQSIVLDRGSDQKSIWYRFRVLVTHTTSGNTSNWAYVQIPTFAGFQQPLFSEVNGYRNQTIAPQGDDTQGNPNTGASPLGPFMGENPVHWSSTNRLYLPHFRRDDAFQVFVGFVVKYVRL